MLDDKPILNLIDDKLDRSRLVQDIVGQIRSVKDTSGYVIGLMGPWGYGKSSVLNLVERELNTNKEFTVIRFNPWLFGGAHELAGQFLAEFSAQLKSDVGDVVSDICDKIEEYSDIISPAINTAAVLLGPWAWLSAILHGLISQRKTQKSRFDESALAKKTYIENALRKLSRRIVVIIDDIDRLSREEIKDALRLVRLVGDFPSVTYLLAFDRNRVEAALAEEGGRSYLDKIIQSPYDLPKIESINLTRYFTSQLDDLLKVKKHGTFNKEDWQNYFSLGIAPLIQTPRDAKRVCNALEMSLDYSGEEIAIADLIAIETIRVLFPAVFQKISANPRSFAPTGLEFSRNERNRDNEGAKQFSEVVDCAMGHFNEITELLKRLFPFCKRYTDNTYYDSSSLRYWRKDRKIASPEILDFYLERQFPKNIPSPSMVKQVFESLGDEIQLRRLMGSLDGAVIENIFNRLEDYEDDFQPEFAEPAIRVFLKSAEKLRTEQTHMGDFGADLAVTRIVLRLLRKIGDSIKILGVCEKLLETVTSLSWRLELLEIIGHREGTGHKLVTQENDIRLRDELRKKITVTSIEELLHERHLPMLFNFLKEGGTQDSAVVSKFIEDDRIFFALLKAMKTQTFSQTIGDAAERVKVCLQWRFLEHLIGADLLKNRILGLEHDKIPSDNDVNTSFELAIRYVKGELSPDTND
jgi:predicted KAP-like P-loop ATPase